MSIASVMYRHLNLGPVWKSLRRAAHEVMTPEACEHHLPIQAAEASQLMFDILMNPKVEIGKPF